MRPRRRVEDPEFAQLLAMQPYRVTLDGLSLWVEEDVFPPDLGRTARHMARACERYAPAVALDMGCGSGYLALTLRRLGVREVWASDVHTAAVACTRRNVTENPDCAPLTVVASDVFEAIPAGLRFGLIVFHQPYEPPAGKAAAGCVAGGRDLVRRFLSEAPARLAADGAIVMAFSDRAAAQHDPAAVARELGYGVVPLLHAYYGGANNYVHEFRPPA